MIRLLNYNDKALIQKNTSRGASALRIKALLKAYGMGRRFISFYGNEDGSILICVQDNFAVAYLKNKTYTQEVSEFLSLTVNSVLSDYPLNLYKYKIRRGNTYVLKKWDNVLLENVSNEIQTGYNLLSKVFTKSINSVTYNRWYTDLSHRVRHNMSKIYTYNNACSATAYLFNKGTVMITQLATLEQERGKGLARQLLFHIASDKPNTKEILLLSQSETSDKFYEKIGFIPMAKWYCYER